MRRYAYSRPSRVATHFPSLSRGYDINPNVYMFTQDMHLSVMPIGGRTDKHLDFSVSFEGKTSESERAMELCGSLAQYERHDAVTLVCDAVDQMATHLAWQGRAVHEIIRDNDDPRKYYLHGFTAKRLFRLLGYYIQCIPARDYDLWKKRFIIVPSKHIWEISIPSALGGALGYKRVLSRLQNFEHFGPKFWRSDLEKQIQTKDFNFQEYVLNSEIYYSRVTKRWGWNRRDYSQRNCTEFFGIYKSITFKWAQAILREHIISEINQLLGRLKINSKIIISGVPTSKDILRVRQKVMEGEVHFSDAYDQVSI